MKASVALAYYNGGQYIREQIESILPQLGEDDELLISVDAATDGSMSYLMEVSMQDQRVHLLEGPGKGVIKNFEYAILHCTGDIILLSDQDDIWSKDKMKIVKKYFDRTSGVALLHNADLVDENGQPLGQDMFTLRNSRPGFVKNFMKNSYVGCCMAFRKELVPLICPIPESVYMHDFWIGTVAQSYGRVGMVDKCLVHYRRHGANVTGMTHGAVKDMLVKRTMLIPGFVQLGSRLIHHRRKMKEF